MSEPKCYQATPHGTLLEQLMDSRVAKTEREWAACREIERKDAAIAELVGALKGLMLHESRSRIMPIGIEWDAARAAIAKYGTPKDGL